MNLFSDGDNGIPCALEQGRLRFLPLQRCRRKERGSLEQSRKQLSKRPAQLPSPKCTQAEGGTADEKTISIIILVVNYSSSHRSSHGYPGARKILRHGETAFAQGTVCTGFRTSAGFLFCTYSILHKFYPIE